MSLMIRPLTPADAPAWRRLWRDYLAFYDTVLPDAQYDLQFSRLLSDDAWEFHCLLAEVDGVPCGLVHYVFHRHGWQAEDICYLQDLYADPQVRGRGLGRALIEAVYGAADTAGARGVYWTTQHFNDTARQLYDRVGELTPFVKYQRPAA